MPLGLHTWAITSYKSWPMLKLFKSRCLHISCSSTLSSLPSLRAWQDLFLRVRNHEKYNFIACFMSCVVKSMKRYKYIIASVQNIIKYIQNIICARYIYEEPMGRIFRNMLHSFELFCTKLHYFAISLHYFLSMLN